MLIHHHDVHHRRGHVQNKCVCFGRLPKRASKSDDYGRERWKDYVVKHEVKIIAENRVRYIMAEERIIWIVIMPIPLGWMKYVF